ncbi:MAG: hypothetical protein Q4F57_02425 [Weeksellaceae bacterium]|nr:hypothetical protein [Weeksellaceae bacterium]
MTIEQEYRQQAEHLTTEMQQVREQIRRLQLYHQQLQEKKVETLIHWHHARYHSGLFPEHEQEQEQEQSAKAS